MQQAPVVLVLNICLPVVDYTLDDHGWSKLLNSTQAFIIPIMIIILRKCKSLI